MFQKGTYEYLDATQENDQNVASNHVQYQLMAINGAGSGFSEPHDVIMPKKIPDVVPTDLEVEALGKFKADF